MISEKGPRFNSKILLFGEYSLMSGSEALSMPYDKLYGQLLFDSNAKGESDHYSTVYLKEYLSFLDDNSFKDRLNLQEFRDDIGKGLYFECNIPISYGLGSSGAIVASIFHAYSHDNAITDLVTLKTTFSEMESYYHGQSSGLDPMVSFLNKPIHISSNGEIRTVDLPSIKNVFLIDTKSTGETQPLVAWYLEKYNDQVFKNKIQNILIPSVNICINGLLNHNVNYFDQIKSISRFTYDNFKEMIPESIMELWKKGLDTEEYYLKLCGSGGGGMMLCFANNDNFNRSTLSCFETHKL